MSTDDMEIRIRLSGARAAAGEMKGLKAEVVGTGAATERAGRSSRKAGQAFGSLRGKVGALTSSYRSAAKGILAAGAAFASYEGLKSSVDTTVKLGRATIGLTKNLGDNTRVASEWAAVAETRGVDAKALNMSFGKLSTNIDTANKAWRKQHQALSALGTTQADQIKRQALLAKSAGPQADAFKALGVSQETLAKGNFNKILGETADGLKKMGPGAERTALSMKLFGRGWQTIVPVLRDGKKAMNEELAMVRKAGATFGGKSIRSIGDYVKAQRQMKATTMGLQIAVGTLLVPILTKAMQTFSKFVYQMRTGTGAGGRFRDKVEQIWKAAKPVVFWFGRAAKNVFTFVSHHPGIVKVAAALFLAGKALKLMRFGSILAGIASIARTKAGAKAVSAIVGKTGLGKLAPLSRAIGQSAGRALSGAFGVAALAGVGMIAEKFANEFMQKVKDLVPEPFKSGIDITRFSSPLTAGAAIAGSKAGQPVIDYSGAFGDATRGVVGPGGVVNIPRSGGGGKGGHHGPSSHPKVVEGDTIHHTVVMLGDRPVWEAWERHNRRKANRK